jgi:hypothetical protein
MLTPLVLPGVQVRFVCALSRKSLQEQALMPMLKARIFSNHPGHADGLAEALKQQGYLVEVLRPEQAPGPSADLEIVLETCAGVDAVRRAAELAQEFEADVAVAPGMLTEAPGNANVHAFTESAPEPAQVAQKAETEFHRQPALQDSAHERPVTEPVSPQHAKTSRAGEPAVIERQKAEPGILARAVPRAAVILTEWATSAREAFFSARAQSREYREHAMIRFALVRANREERLLELTHHRIEAQEQASQLAAARKNAAAYLLQLARESGGKIGPTNRGLSEEPGPETLVRPWRALFEGLLERVRPVRWDSALAGLASAGALFAVGLAVASFSTKPNLTMGSEPPAATTPAPASAPSAATAVAPTAKPAVRTGSRKPSPAQHSSRASRDRSEDREEGNDVVVRHLVSPSPTPKQQARWKHFSDMDH